MGNFPGLELTGYFDLVPFLQEVNRFLQVERDIVFLNPRTDLYTLYFLLFALVLLLLLLGRVLIPAVIDDFSNRRGRRRRDKYKIESLFFGHRERLTALDNANLFAFCADDAQISKA